MLKFFSANKLLGLVLLLWALLQLILLISYPLNHRPTLVISWDTFGYYLYLPATFIYHDLFQLHFVGDIMHKYPLSEYFYAARIGPSGNYVMNYSLGTAILYLPFFFIGHLLAALLHYDMDGFSAPYQYAIYAGGAVYTLAGIVLTMRNLRFFFTEKLSALLLIILLLGTNYFYYTVIENAMTHNYLFTVGACIIYCTIKWHQQQKLRQAFAVGLLIGLAIVIRPTEILWCFIPLLWALKDFNTLQQKLLLVKQNLLQVLCLITGVVLVGLIQMAYWKAASGKFIYYSYDGFFDFLDPHISLGLFSLRKGWLVYTPVMALALLGIPFLWRSRKELLLVCLTYTVAIIYITFSWHAWPYGGSFGARPMVEAYALLLFPMGALLQTAFKNVLSKYLLLVFIAACVFLNGFQTWQYLQGFISHEGPDDYSYKVMFLKTHWDRPMIRDYFKLEPAPVKVSNSLLVYPSKTSPVADSVIDTTYTVSDSTGVVIFDTDVDATSYNYLRINGRAMFEPFQDTSELFCFMQIKVNSLNKNAEIINSTMPLQPLIGNQRLWWVRDLKGVPGVWDDVFMYLPLATREPLHVTITLKNPGQNTLHFNTLRLNLLKATK